MKITLAVFKNEYGSPIAIAADETGDCWADRSPDYVRATEFIEVDFPDLDRDQVIEKQLASLDAQEKKARADLAVALMLIEDRRASLLALAAPN